jgi:hypothetical protein
MKSTRPDFATIVQITGLSEGLRGAPRPGHFDGVATVVTKRLIQSLPDVAYFGEKDYQQLLVVRRVARDLDIPVRIAGVTTIREPDALALSSRSAYRSPEEGRTPPIPVTSPPGGTALGGDALDVAPQFDLLGRECSAGGAVLGAFVGDPNGVVHSDGHRAAGDGASAPGSHAAKGRSRFGA